MKKIIAVLLLALTVLSLFAACGKDNGQQAYVESVAVITGTGYSGLNNRYSGIVESGSTYSVLRDKEKKILELNVSVGDKVSAGDVLFTYDVQAVKLSVKKLELECEQLENSLELLKKNIKDYEKKVSGASGSKKLEYEVQLQTYQIDEKEKTLELSIKETELKEAKGMLANSDVSSKITGVVQTINEDQAGETDENGEIIPYITIIETGAYKVRGTASELDINSIFEGSPVIIRSRVDDTTWTGTVDYIEWDNPEKNQNEMFYDGNGSENASASRYPFHVSLDSTDGLLLGQHVYIEPGVDSSEGLWLPEYYIMDAPIGSDSDADSDPWVWAVNRRDRLEKRTVQLGEYDPESCCYEILSGLTPEDYIAFPDDTLSEGMGTVTEDMMTEDFPEDDMIIEDGAIYPEDGMYDDSIMVEDIYMDDIMISDDFAAETEVLG